MEVRGRPGGVVGGERLVPVGVVAKEGAVGVQFVGEPIERVPLEGGLDRAEGC